MKKDIIYTLCQIIVWVFIYRVEYLGVSGDEVEKRSDESTDDPTKPNENGDNSSSELRDMETLFLSMLCARAQQIIV